MKQNTKLMKRSEQILNNIDIMESLSRMNRAEWN